MYQQDASLGSAINRQIEKQHQLRDQAERELLGFDHAEVGYLLIKAWGLSEELCELVHCHHQYQLSRKHARGCQILALANRLADHETGLDLYNDIRYTSMIEVLGISPSSIAEIVESAAQQCAVRDATPVTGTRAPAQLSSAAAAPMRRSPSSIASGDAAYEMRKCPGAPNAVPGTTATLAFSRR